MLALVHMLKTGGTAFAEVVDRLAPDRVRRDYDDIPLSNRPLHAVRRRSAQSSVDAGALDADLIYGHFLLSKYAQLGARIQLGALFREPLARIVSHYFHYLRNQGSARNEILPPGLTLLDFARLPKYCDMYRFLLGGVPVSDLDFVGITEDLPRSARLLAVVLTGCRSGVEDFAIGRRNCATEYDDPLAYLRDQGIYDDVVVAQAVNREIYSRARERFAALCARYGV